MNVVVLIGRMVADPELKYTPSGVAVCSFTIAVDRRFKSQSGERETDFFDVVAWRQAAEFAANYLTKGELVAVQGQLQTRKWVQQDGQKRSKTEVVAEQLKGLHKPQGGQQQREAPPMPGPEYAPAEAPTGGADADMDYDPFAEE